MEMMDTFSGLLHITLLAEIRKEERVMDTSITDITIIDKVSGFFGKIIVNFPRYRRSQCSQF